MKNIKVRYFALLREQAKTENETLQTGCKTLGELYNSLKEKHGFSLPLEMIQVAVNDEFSHITSEVPEGARIVFIPPVAGG